MKKTAEQIANCLNITLEQANLVRGIFDNKIDPMSIKDCYSWVNSCYNEPSNREKKLCALNSIIGGYGVEAIQEAGNYHESPCVYINMGDTYTNTICFYEGQYHYTSWGDAVEYLESQGIEIN
jgi:hypothetical protein